VPIGGEHAPCGEIAERLGLSVDGSGRIQREMYADDRPLILQEETVVRLILVPGRGHCSLPLLDTDPRALVRVQELRHSTYIVVFDGADDGRGHIGHGDTVRGRSRAGRRDVRGAGGCGL